MPSQLYSGGTPSAKSSPMFPPFSPRLGWVTKHATINANTMIMQIKTETIKLGTTIIIKHFVISVWTVIVISIKYYISISISCSVTIPIPE